MISCVKFFPRVVAEQLTPRNIAFISFYDAGEEPAELQEGWAGVLRIRCHDKDEAAPGLELFEHSHALQVKDFVDQHKECEALYVHCSLGQSRSGGLALAISEFLGVPCFKQSLPVDTFKYTIYNKLVYSKTLNTLHGVPDTPSVDSPSSMAQWYADNFPDAPAVKESAD